MMRSGSGLAGMLGAAVLAIMALPAEAAVFVIVQPDIAHSEERLGPPAALEATRLDTKRGSGAVATSAITIESPSPAAPMRAGWVPLIGALALVAYRMRRPDGRSRFASAV